MRYLARPDLNRSASLMGSRVILQNTERVRYFVGLTADVAGDPAGRIVSLGDGGEH